MVRLLTFFSRFYFYDFNDLCGTADSVSILECYYEIDVLMQRHDHWALR